MRKEVKWFADLMEEKLQKNDYKGGWEYENSIYFHSELLEEIKELENAINDKQRIEECVDIANFAMMLADHYQGRRERLEGKKTMSESMDEMKEKK